MTTRTKPLGPGQSKMNLSLTKSEQAKVQLTYHSHSTESSLVERDGTAQRILRAMMEAAAQEDLRILAEQQPENVREGELLSRGFVITRWFEVDEDNIRPIDKREATAEDTERLEEW